MNKFKFGDKVVHEEYGTGVVVDESNGIDGVSVLFHGDTRPCLLSKEEVIPTPHPDTARLDWLEMREINDQWPLIEWDDYLGEWKLKLPDDSKLPPRAT